MENIIINTEYNSIKNDTNQTDTDASLNDKNNENINEADKKCYTFFQTYSSKNNPFNFKIFKLRDGIIFFIIAIILPFLINIIVTYAHYIKPNTSDQHYLSQRFWLNLFSIICSLMMLIYLWAIYGRKFVSNGGLAFFWMSIFMPIMVLIFSLIIQKTIFYQNSSEDNKFILDTINQMLAELISVIVILLTTKGLAKRIINTYKDGWVFYVSVMVGMASIFAFNAIISLIPKLNTLFNSFLTSSNQGELNKLLSSVTGIIVLGIFTLLIAPFMEELTTRNGIYTICGNKWLGLVASTIYFAGMHVADYGDWQSIIDYIGPAFILSFLFLFSNGNVAYTITLHAFINVIAYISSIINHMHG